MKRIKVLRFEDGREPFLDWLGKLDKPSQHKINSYIKRVAIGGARKNIKPVGIGVYEIKINYGPGYRVYFSEVRREIILLLLGGDKSTQQQDIKYAILLWRMYVSK